MGKWFFAVAALAALIGVSAPVSADVVSTALSNAASQTVVPAEFVPPVDAIVIDPFRPPDQPWLPGNRGLEYDTTPGQRVVAAADGVVTFAGQVGGNLFVTIRHDPDLVTTVGFLESFAVSTGETVRQGDVVATAGETMHFTARRNGRYIDPQGLLHAVRIHVRLVPVPR